MPSGNFGNILAGHVAREMGLPIRRLILATNENDVLDEFFRTGRYRPRQAGETHATSSPVDGHLQGVELRALRVRRRRPRSRGRARRCGRSSRASGGFELAGDAALGARRSVRLRLRAQHARRPHRDDPRHRSALRHRRRSAHRRRAQGRAASIAIPPCRSSASRRRCRRNSARRSAKRSAASPTRPPAYADLEARPQRLRRAARRRRSGQGVSSREHAGRRVMRAAYAHREAHAPAHHAHHAANLARNLVRGPAARAVPAASSRFAFRVDLVQLLLLFVVSALIDVGGDWCALRRRGLLHVVRRRHRDLRCRRAAADRGDARACLRAARARAGAAGDRARGLSAAAGRARRCRRVLLEPRPGRQSCWTVFEYCDRRGSFALLDALRRVVARAGAVGPLAARDRRRAAAAAPIWFAPSIAPNDPWWQEPSADGAEPRYPNPASEPVLAAQQHLLDEALSRARGRAAGRHRSLLRRLRAAMAREDVFRKDVEAAQHVMDERWGTDGRSVLLINNPQTLLESPVRHRHQSARDAERDRRDDRCRGRRRHGLPREPRQPRSTCSRPTLPPLELAPLTAPALARLLDDAGIKWRIIVVSACYSGGFIDAAHGRLHARADGVGRGSHVVRLRQSQRQHVLRRGVVPAGARASRLAAGRVRRGEGARGGARDARAGSRRRRIRRSTSAPAMADKLKELDRGNAARRTGAAYS